MSILADFFVATSDDAHKYATPASFRDGALIAKVAPAAYKGFTTVEIGMLWAILAREEWNVPRHDLVDESLEGEEESWLFRFPQPLVQLLGTATENELSLANEQWARTEELKCSPSDLLPVTLDLQRLARKSAATGNPMYLWGSL
jgi:hypothetical protein